MHYVGQLLILRAHIIYTEPSQQARTVTNIKVLFIHQLMHHWVVLKNNIKIYIKFYIKTVTPKHVGAVLI